MPDNGLPIARPGDLRRRPELPRSRGGVGPELPEVPILFAKLPNSVIGPGEPIVVPRATEQPDYEAELGVVIGRTRSRCRSTEPSTTWPATSAATTVGARDLQFAPASGRAARRSTRSCPVGPTRDGRRGAGSAGARHPLPAERRRRAGLHDGADGLRRRRARQLHQPGVHARTGRPDRRPGRRRAWGSRGNPPSGCTTATR